MRALLFTALALIIAGIVLIITSFTVELPEVGGGFAGCVIIFFIPICFAGGNSQVLPYLALVGLGVFLAVLIFTLTLIKLMKQAGRATLS